jgi:hypothetical protein
VGAAAARRSRRWLLPGGDPNPESGSYLGSGNPNPSEKEDQLGEEPT